MTGKRQPIIVLLGVHRSGTSLTMSVLNALGIQCGDRLIPAARGNETGFWEHANIVATHEQLLAEFNRVWHGPMGSHPMPMGWMDGAAAQRAKRKLIQIVNAELADANGRLWGFKDPRSCRLLPLWERFSQRRIPTPNIFWQYATPLP